MVMLLHTKDESRLDYNKPLLKN